MYVIFNVTGRQDIVYCFQCGEGLRNWDPEDEPWEEHARHFPDCAYVEQMKGARFVLDMVLKYRKTVSLSFKFCEVASFLIRYIILVCKY